MISRLVLGILLFIILYAVRGVCESAPVVIVLCTAEKSVVLQLKAELDTVGYRALPLIYPKKFLTPLETDKMLETHDAIALINMTDEERGVEVWVSSGTIGGGKLVETVGEPGKPISVATILKSVESLRASLMQFDTLKLQAKPEKTVNDDSESLSDGELDKTDSSLETTTLSINIGAMSQHGLGRFSPPARLNVALIWWFNDHFALYGAPTFPIYPMKADNHQGEVSVFEGQFLLGVRQYLGDAAARYRPWLGIGIGPSLMRIIGHADDGWKSSNDTLLLVVLSGQIGLSISLTETIGIQMACFSSFSLFLRPIVVLGEKQLPTENPVVIGGSLSLTVALF